MPPEASGAEIGGGGSTRGRTSDVLAGRMTDDGRSSDMSRSRAGSYREGSDADGSSKPED